MSGSPPYLPAARNSGRAERVARGRLYGRQGFMATNPRLRTFVICVKGDVHCMAIGGSFTRVTVRGILAGIFQGTLL